MSGSSHALRSIKPLFWATKSPQSLWNCGLKAGRGEWIVVFNPEQIKSATDNIGTYKESNPDIRFSFKDDKNYKVFLQSSGKGMTLASVKRFLPDWGKGNKPIIKSTPEETCRALAQWIKNLPETIITAFDGSRVNLLNPEKNDFGSGFRDEIEKRVWHAITNDISKSSDPKHRELVKQGITRVYDIDRAKMFVNIVETISDGQVRIGGGADATRSYVRKYGNVVHKVVLTKDGFTQDVEFVLTTSYLLYRDFKSNEVISFVSDKLKKENSALLQAESERASNISQSYVKPSDEQNAFESNSSSSNHVESSKTSQRQGKNTNFSFADNPIHETKRALAKKLAKDMYKRLGDKFDVLNPDARRDVKPTEAERMDIYMADMGLLDDDVDDVCNKAEAILWKLLNSASKKELRGDFDRMAAEAERSFEYSHIVEACVKDAIKNFKDDLDISKRIKEQEQKDLKAEIDGVKGFDIDELAINNIDLTEAVCVFIETEDGELLPNEPRIDAQISAIIDFCKNWANSEDVSYEVAFAKMRATLVDAFNDVSDKFTYGKYIKSAFKSIMQLSESKSEESLKARSEKLARKFADFIAKETKDFAKVKVDAAVEKAESRLKKLHRQSVKMFTAFADGQKLPESNKLETKRKLPARVQAYLAQIKKVIKLNDKKIKERYEYLSKRKSSLEADGEEPNYKERYEMSALMSFGNIKSKTLPEILNAYAELKKLIEGARDGQIKKLEEWEAEIEEKAQPLCASLSLAGNKESVKDGYVYDGAKKNVSMFEHRLRNLFLARKGLSKERGELIERWISDYSQRMSRAAIFERNFANAEMAWLQDELTRLYGNAEAGFERLTKVNKDWSKFASEEGRDMSLGQIMNILCALEQWQVKEAWKNAQKKMERIENNPDAEIDEKFEREYRYWKNLFGSQEAMSELLNDADKALVQSLKARYSQRLEIINPTYERLNGLPMISNGSNYMPIVRLGEFDLDEGGGNVISIFPSYYTPRTISLNRNLSDSMLPASSVTRVMQSALYAVEDVYKNGFSDADWFKHFDRIGKSVFSPYRIGRKIYDNVTEN